VKKNNTTKDQAKDQKEIFSHIKNNFLDYDPAHFVQNNLTLDGQPFSVIGNGWKFLADIYRYIALQATRKNGKSVVICKGRQVGATMMAGALDLYFTNSGLFSNPPIRVAHLFPALALVKRFSQDKLEGLIRDAKNDFINENKLESGGAVDNLTMKQFKTGTLWVESIGADGDRMRGLTIDAAFFDECFPYDQFIETENGKMKIGKIYDNLCNGKQLPRVKTYNEALEIFEYKNIIDAWKREEKELMQINSGHKKIRCTGNHRFLTENGWKRTDELIVGDMIKSSAGANLKVRAINDDQFQIAIGSFLGDGHLSNHGNNRYRLREIHGIKQKDYCEWKAGMFEATPIFMEENGYSKTPAIKFVSKLFGLSENLPKTKTTCPQWVLDKIDARGIAIWYMDDGSTKKWKTGAGGCLSTNSFDEDSQKRIVLKFKSLGIDCCYSISKKKDGRSFYSIRFNKDGFKKLSDLIRKYIHKDIYYKIPGSNHSVSNYKWNNTFKPYDLFIVDEVIKLNKKEVVYDIGVEDNHNFIVTNNRNKRGEYLGGPIAHNCQDMPQMAVGNTTKTLTAAKYGPIGKGVQVFFGTPKEKGSFFESIWDMSSKQYYHLGCKNCKQTFPFYQSGSDSWKQIWIHGYVIKCPLCGHEQHKIDAIENGGWVASNESDNNRYVGFHINQLYIPNLTREYIDELMPANNPTQSDRVWNNEVIGEFYAGVGMPLTRSTIEQLCKDADRSFARSIDPKDKFTYLGLDWGDKSDNDSRGQSWSCAVVLSSTPDGTLLVEHAHKLSERTFNYKKETVHEMYRRFGIKQGVSDFFFGQDVVRDLQMVYNDKFLGAQGSGGLLNPVKYREDELIITYNKDLLIDEIFEKIRKGKIRFPWKSYEYVEWLIDHCTSMGTSMTMKNGQYIKTYVKGTTPNDGLMALMYAYMAWKFDVTERFTIKPGKKEVTTLPKSVLAFAPRLR
jgi:hypothetical protein